MSKITAFDVIGEVRESLISESLTWLDSTAARAAARRTDSLWTRFWRSGIGVAAICAVVSLSVLGAIIWAGQKAPVSPKPPVSTTESEVTETQDATDTEADTAETEAEVTETEAEVAVEDTAAETASEPLHEDQTEANTSDAADLQTEVFTEVITEIVTETITEVVTETVTEAITEAQTQAPQPTVKKWNGSVAKSFGGGTGTAADPYLITSGAELAYLAQSVNGGNAYAGKYFTLMYDLDLREREFTPIGTYEKPFSGIFDGGGHTISGLSISTFTKSDRVMIGLFGHVQDGQLSNLRLDAPKVNVNLNTVPSYVYIGALCGRYANTSKTYDEGGIHTCLVENGVITATRGPTVYAGGVVGHVYASSGVDTLIRHVESRVTINTTEASLSYTGGIAGVLFCKDGSRVEMKDFCCYATISRTPTGTLYIGAVGAGDAADGRLTLRDGYSNITFKGEIATGSSHNSSYKNDGYAMIGLVCQSHLANKYYFYDLTGKLTASNQNHSILYSCYSPGVESGIDHTSAYPKRSSLDTDVWDLSSIRTPSLIFPWES